MTDGNEIEESKQTIYTFRSTLFYVITLFHLNIRNGWYHGGQNTSWFCLLSMKLVTKQLLDTSLNCICGSQMKLNTINAGKSSTTNLQNLYHPILDHPHFAVPNVIFASDFHTPIAWQGCLTNLNKTYTLNHFLPVYKTAYERDVRALEIKGPPGCLDNSAE